MTYKEYLDQLKIGSNYSLLKKAIMNNEIYNVLLGIGKYRQTSSDDYLNVRPTVMLSYFHIFITEELITNVEINEAFRQIKIISKEDVWLLMLYIEASLLYKKNRKIPLVELDVNFQINKINETWEVYKDDYTVKKYTKDIYKITGKPIFG